MAQSRPSRATQQTRAYSFLLAVAACFGLMCFFVGFSVGRHGTQVAAVTAPTPGGTPTAVPMRPRGSSVMDAMTRPLAPTGQLDPDPLEAFMEVYEQLKANYYKPIGDSDKTKLSYGAVRGMLRELGDPYTRFMEPKDYSDFRQDNEGHFKGIGAMLGIDQSTNRVQVIRVFPNNPADKAGLKPGDYVIKVNDQPTDDMSIDVAVSKIRGEAGTTVKLTVSRPDKPRRQLDPEYLRKNGIDPDEPRRDPAPVDPAKLIDVVITRGDVHIPIVESEMLPGNQGYVHLAMFNEESYKQLTSEIEALRGKGMKGLIIDVRDNPGGNLEEVIRMGAESDLLFSPDTLLMPSSEGISAEVRQNPNAIGYDGLGYVTSDQKMVGIAVDTSRPYVLPAIETVNDGTYPISRDLYMYTAGEPAGPVKLFLDYIVGQGQGLVAALGFVPLQ